MHLGVTGHERDVGQALVRRRLGDRLRIGGLRARRGLLLPLNVVQLLVTSTLVFIALQVVGVGVQVALLLALIAAETGVLTVTATVKEQRAAGETTDVVLASVALTNVAVAAAFGLAFPVVLAFTGAVSSPAAIVGAFAQIVVGSTVIGLLGGVLLTTYGPAIESSGELLLFLLVVLTAITGAAIAIDGSVVATSLVSGLYVANAAPWLADRFFAAVRTLEAPIYLIFFVVAGADIHIDELAGAGLVGAAYVVARTIGKVAGATGGAVPPHVDRGFPLAGIAAASRAETPKARAPPAIRRGPVRPRWPLTRAPAIEPTAIAAE